MAANPEPALLPRLLPIETVQFIGTLGYSVAIPFLVYLVSDLGGATWTYGLVGATYSAFQLLGAPLLGRWSDRAGRRRVLAVSQAGTFVAWLIFLLALALPRTALASLWGATLTLPLLLVFVARALDGLTGGNVSVASAYVADVTMGRGDPVRQRAFGRVGMAASLGFAVGPALAGFLGATAWGYSAPVAAAAAASAAATVIVLVFLREPPARCPEGPPQQPTVTLVLGQQDKRCDRAEPKLRSSGVLAMPGVAPLLVSTLLFFCAFNLFYASFPVHVSTSLGWSSRDLGEFFSVLAVAMIIAQGPVLRYASRRWSPKTVFALGISSLAAAFLCYRFHSGALLYTGASLFALGNGLAWPTFQTQVARVAGVRDQGAVQGAITSASSVASILGLLAGAMLYPKLGSGVFVLAAALFVAVGLGTPIWFRSSTSGSHRSVP